MSHALLEHIPIKRTGLHSKDEYLRRVIASISWCWIKSRVHSHCNSPLVSLLGISKHVSLLPLKTVINYSELGTDLWNTEDDGQAVDSNQTGFDSLAHIDHFQGILHSHQAIQSDKDQDVCGQVQAEHLEELYCLAPGNTYGLIVLVQVTMKAHSLTLYPQPKTAQSVPR